MDLSKTITGLINGQSYEVRVRARNIIGESDWTTLTSTPSTVPSAPQNIVVSKSGSTIHTTWTAPASDGFLAISNYRIRVKVGSASAWGTAIDSGDQPNDVF